MIFLLEVALAIIAVLVLWPLIVAILIEATAVIVELAFYLVPLLCIALVLDKLPSRWTRFLPVVVFAVIFAASVWVCFFKDRKKSKRNGPDLNMPNQPIVTVSIDAVIQAAAEREAKEKHAAIECGPRPLKSNQ